VRAVEKAVAAVRRAAGMSAELDVAAVGTITEDEWRACWPLADEAEPEPEPVTEEPAVDDAEASSDDPEKD
ncbi:MAG TPA: nucleoside triphosphate pyrophosphohydrolase, partial [Mycobacterium sp.]|nr:nucleoside triphosphate pyrophosphohydrolase [Mycobacterium sp.]